MKTYLVALLLIVFWPQSSALAQDKERILVDCGWIAGYLHGVATLRDGGAGEAQMTERVEELVKAEHWPERLKVHLTRRIHLMFADYKGEPPYLLSGDYLHNCMQAGGDIPENFAENQSSPASTRVAQGLQ